LPDADDVDVDDAMAAISAPPFVVPTTRIGTAGGFLRFGGGGGDRRCTFFVPLAVDMPLAALPAGLGGTRASEVRIDAGTSGDVGDSGTKRAPTGDNGWSDTVPNEL